MALKIAGNANSIKDSNYHFSSIENFDYKTTVNEIFKIVCAQCDRMHHFFHNDQHRKQLITEPGINTHWKVCRLNKKGINSHYMTCSHQICILENVSNSFQSLVPCIAAVSVYAGTWCQHLYIVCALTNSTHTEAEIMPYLPSDHPHQYYQTTGWTFLTMHWMRISSGRMVLICKTQHQHSWVDLYNFKTHTCVVQRSLLNAYVSDLWRLIKILKINSISQQIIIAWEQCECLNKYIHSEH